MKEYSKKDWIDWLEDYDINHGWMYATDGCIVEPDGECPHGCESILIALGHI